MKSLDPRVNRMTAPSGILSPKDPLDQFGTFEVFTQLKEDKAYVHTGAVHAPGPEMAFLFAKEQFSRRQTCTGLFVAETSKVYTTPFSDNDLNIYQGIASEADASGEKTPYEIFHLLKRGKQHVHIGSVEAKGYDHALSLAKPEFVDGPPIYNIWVVRTGDILFNDEEDRKIWATLPEKQFREALAYRAGEKLKDFKEKNTRNE